MTSGQNDKKKPPSKLVETLALLFATPAALNVLAAFDKRLDFTPLLERMVLNFKSISNYVWSQIDGYFQFDFPEYYQPLTFLLLLVLPTMSRVVSLYLIYRRDPKNQVVIIPELGEIEIGFSTFIDRQNAGLFLGTACFFFIVFLAVLFDLMVLFLPSFILIGLTAVLFLAWGWVANKIGMELYEDEGAMVILTIIALSILGLMGNIVFPSEFSFWGAVVFLVGLVLAGCWMFFPAIFVLFIMSFGAKNIAYIALWVAGVLVINWIATIGVPAVEAFLDATER